MTLCPIPVDRYPIVTAAHGGGGRLTRMLVEKMLLETFRYDERPAHDAMVTDIGGHEIAFTTDSYVVNPYFFPGGDIGSLAVNGTVNDLLMAGARPQAISLGLILEEGLPMDTLWKIVRSVRAAADAAGVVVGTGDTKVVERGKGDGIYINTSGIGRVLTPSRICPSKIEAGDAVVLSGDIGRHGIAVMAAREGIRFESTLESDCAPLNQPVLDLIEARIDIHCLRDLTRGGLAAALHELASASQTTIVLEQKTIAVDERVRGASEMLGLDPIHIANEGRFVAIVPQECADRALEILSASTSNAAIVGTVEPRQEQPLHLKTAYGNRRVVDLPSGSQLPRIC